MITAILAVAALVPLQQDEDIKRWIEQLTSDYEDERKEARAKLEESKEKAEPHLIDALGKDDHRIRRACIDLLLACKSKKAVEPIAKVFKDDKEERTVRQAAFDYLKSCPKESELHLIDALDTNEEGWKIGALDALKEINSAKCAEKVATLYDKEQNVQVKAKAFDCLQNIGKPAQPYLLKLLGSTDSAVRLGALNGLQNIGADNNEILEPVAKIFKTETADAVLDKAYSVLITAKEKAEPHFVEGLKSAQEIVRLKSLMGLQELQLESAIPAIGECFESDTVDKVRERAREALESFKKKSENVLCKALDNKNAKVRQEAIKALTAVASEQPFKEIAKLYETDPDKDVHKLCFAYLLAVPQLAEKQLLLALKDEDADIRKKAIDALGNGKVLSAIDPLLDLLGHLDPDIKLHATDALVRIGPKAIEAVNAGVGSGKVKKPAADEILAKFYQEEVERLLYDQITSDGGTGFYEGQFKAVEAFGKEKAVPVLMKMILDDQYQFRLDPADKGSNSRDYVRELAILAMGSLGDESTVKRFREYLKDKSPEDKEFAHFAVAIHRLGEKAELDRYTKAVTKEAEDRLKNPDERQDGFDKLFMLGVVLNRVGARSEALKTYERVEKLVEEHKAQQTWQGDRYGATLYNIACIHALAGTKDKAVAYLERSVDAGFKDKQWIEMDKDLDGIRGEAGYKALLGDAKRFEKKKE